MTDRTTAEVMCCGGECIKPPHQSGACQMGKAHRYIRNLHAAGYMIVSREPTDAVLRAASMRQQPSLGQVYPSVYRAMADTGELK